MDFYIYTETAFHHEGDFDYLIKLIDASKEVGAHGIKFQILIDLDNLTSSRHSLYPKLKSCLFTIDEWKKVLRHCAEIGLDIIAMPLDEQAFEVLQDEQYKIKYLDLHSVSFNDQLILGKILDTGIPLILGVGGRTIDEINDKIDFFDSQLQVLMVGFQSYPSKLEDVKLERIRLFNDLYPELQLGYADHTSFDDEMAIKSNEYAYLLGAKFFEKHITVDQGKQRLDFQSALGKDGVKKIISNLKYLDEEVMKHSFTDLKTISEPELTYRNRQKVAVAKMDLEEGTVITKDNILFKMTEAGVGVQNIRRIIGNKTNCFINRDEAVLISSIADS